MIYLDNAATSFPRPESVYAEMDYVNRNLRLTLAVEDTDRQSRRQKSYLIQSRKLQNCCIVKAWQMLCLQLLLPRR